MRRFHDLRGRIVQLAFSADGESLVARVRGGKNVPVWGLADGSFRRWHPGTVGVIAGLAFAPDARWFATGDEGGRVFAFEYPDFDAPAVAQFPQDFSLTDPSIRTDVSGLAFGWTADRADCRLALTAGGGVWLAEMGGTADMRRVPVDHVHGPVALAPDGRLLAAAVSSRTFALRLHDLGTNRSGGRVELKRPVRSVAITADGNTVVAATADAVRGLVADGLVTRFVCAHPKGQISDLAAHPTRNLVATAGTDGTVRFWDAGTGAAAGAFDWQLGRVTAIAFAPDGLTCAAGGENGEVVVWDVE